MFLLKLLKEETQPLNSTCPLFLPLDFFPLSPTLSLNSSLSPSFSLFPSHGPLFVQFPHHFSVHLCPALHKLLPLPIPWCLWFLSSPSLCLQCIFTSGPPPFFSLLWDFRFSPGRGSYYHGHSKRLTTCHEKIVECQGHKNLRVWKTC